MRYPPEKCIEALQRANERVDGHLSYDDYRDLDISPSLDTIAKRFGTFNEAKEEAGLDTMERGEYSKRQPPAIRMMNEGYIRCRSRLGSADDEDQIDDAFLMHRLVAVAEFGFDAVDGNHVHHKNGIPWDNRPQNLDIVSPTQHGKIHTGEQDRDRDRDRDDKGRFVSEES